MAHARSRGFTLIEMIVVVAIIVALAGILVPMVSSELDNTKSATAQATVNRVATSLTQFLKDTGFPPNGKNGDDRYDVLYGAGTYPKGLPAGAAKYQVAKMLTTNGTKTKKWKGPYLQDLTPDPWGNAYVVNVNGYASTTERVWVLSAGPDGTIETTMTATKLAGDDIGIVIE